jgi:hypothetical protein
MHGAVVVSAGCSTTTPQGSVSVPSPARVPSSSRLIVAVWFVIPVTTASGNGDGIRGVGDGVAVGDGDGEADGDCDGDADGVGTGLTSPHAASSDTAATTLTTRYGHRLITALS